MLGEKLLEDVLLLIKSLLPIARTLPPWTAETACIRGVATKSSNKSIDLSTGWVISDPIELVLDPGQLRADKERILTKWRTNESIDRVYCNSDVGCMELVLLGETKETSSTVSKFGKNLIKFVNT